MVTDIGSLEAELLPLIVGLALSTIISLLAFHRRALTAGGVVGAIAVGTITFGFGGWTWGLVIVAFFTLSSALSRYRATDKKKLADKFGKGARRDLGQVLANGGLASLLALLYCTNPAPPVLAAFLGAIATVTADTWGTEIGVLSPTPPRLITTGRRVPGGTSGGVTLLGTAASMLGALFIGLVGYTVECWQAVLASGSPLLLSWIVPATLVSGLLGSLFDSLLGATVQGIFYCAACETETEKEVHGCGLRTSHLRGWRWLNNDAVNFLSSVCGALIAVALWGVIREL
jgi:uncharacterized protein (TIGR00297 family)